MNVQVKDDIDALSFDIFLQDILKLAKKKWKEAGSHVGKMERMEIVYR